MEPEVPQSATDAQKKAEADTLVKPLRTYERDIAEMIRLHQTSAVSVNLAQQRKKEVEIKKVEPLKNVFEKTTPVKSVPIPIKEKVISFANISPDKEEGVTKRFARNTLFGIFGIVLVSIGVGVFALVYFLNQKPKSTPIAQRLINTFIPVDQEKELNIDNLNSIKLVANFSELTNSDYPKDSITYVKILAQNATSSVAEADAYTFFEALAPNIPPSLTRAFDKKMFAGIYTSEKKHPVFIIQIDAFDKAFEGMLLWEKNLYSDLGMIFRTQNTTDQTLAGIPLLNFEDLIVQNKDARILRDNQGETIMLYSFIDSKTLFIVDNQDTFKEILNRFSTSKLIR